MEKQKNAVTDKELKQLADIYKQLQEPNRSIITMGINLLLASQTANEASMPPEPRKAG